MSEYISKVVLPDGEEYEIKDGNALHEKAVYTIHEDDCTIETDATKGVAPYSTSYGYTNVTVDPSAGIEWREGAIYHFIIDTKLIVSGTYRNVRIRIGEEDDWHPVMGYSSSILAGSSYFVKAMTVLFVYKTVYQSVGALHLLYDSNTTYSYLINAIAGDSTDSAIVIDAKGYGARYSLIFPTTPISNDDGVVVDERWSSLVASSSTGTTKKLNTGISKYYIDRHHAYVYSANVVAGAKAVNSVYQDYTNFDVRYTVNTNSTYVTRNKKCFLWLKNFDATEMTFEADVAVGAIVSIDKLATKFPSTVEGEIYLYYLGWTGANWYQVTPPFTEKNVFYQYTPSTGDLKIVSAGISSGGDYDYDAIADAVKDKVNLSDYDKVFIAEYGKTTVEEIATAVADHKDIRVEYSGRVYNYASYANGVYYFSSLSGGNYFYRLQLSESNGAWGNSQTTAQQAINDLDTIRSGAALGATALQSYTETDPTVPDWAKQSSKPTYTASEVGALPDTTTIPTKLSDLTADATHRVVTDTEKSTWSGKQDAISDLSTIRSGAALGATALQSYTETDPTVPAWAKAASKPSYTASEVGAPSTDGTGATGDWGIGVNTAKKLAKKVKFWINHDAGMPMSMPIEDPVYQGGVTNIVAEYKPSGSDFYGYNDVMLVLPETLTNFTKLETSQIDVGDGALTVGEDGVPKANGNPIALATESTVGFVKPDGETITVDADGVISTTGGGEVKDGYLYVGDNPEDDDEIEAEEPQLDATTLNGYTADDFIKKSKVTTSTNVTEEGFVADARVITNLKPEVLRYADVTFSEHVNGINDADKVRCVMYKNGLRVITGFMSVTATTTFDDLFTVPDDFKRDVAHGGHVHQSWIPIVDCSDGKVYNALFQGNKMILWGSIRPAQNHILSIYFMY